MIDIEGFLANILHYEPFEIEITMEDIQSADEESKSVIEQYIQGADISEYGYRYFTVKKLMEEKGFNAIAAILSISNLKKDYTKYVALYERAIK